MAIPDVIFHFGAVVEGSIAVGDAVDAYVDPIRREDTARNHSATHMLHAALRAVLGAHVRQAGSLVAPDRLRFDFSHVQPMTDDELWQVQLLVNEKIRQNARVLRDEDSYSSAIDRGALAFFGDKYGDRVRLIEIANGDSFSFEVCGGTHVRLTGEVGAVYILGESSIGAGMRRLEAVSGRAAEKLVWDRFGQQDRLARRLQTGLPEVESRVQGLLDEIDQLRRERESLERRIHLQEAETLLSSKQQVAGVTVLAVQASASDADSLREVGDWLRDKLVSGVVVLGSVLNGRPMLVVMVTQDLVARGFDASVIAKGAAKAIQGGGGGRPDVAQAGGRLADKLEEALGLVPALVREAGNAAP
jgi:alanyl-tRNA synthetase